MKALRVVALVLVLVTPALAVAQDELPPEVAAKIDDEVIPTKEVADRAFQVYGQMELLRLIHEKLVEQEAKREGVVITDQQVQAEIEKLRKKLGNKFPEYLASIRSSEKLLPDQIRHEMRIRKLVGEKIEVTEEDIQRFYNAPENRGRYIRPESVRLRWIITDTEEEAKQALAALRRGDKFAEVVTKYSVDESTKKRGGDVAGDLARGQLKPELKPLEDQAFALALNKVSDVIAAGGRFWIIEVTAKRGEEHISLAAVHDDIGEEIFERRLDEKSRDWLRDLLEQARKEINRSLWE